MVSMIHCVVSILRSLKVAGGTGKTVAELSQGLANMYGLMPKLPSWLGTGAIIGLQGGTQRVMIIPVTITHFL